MDVIKRIDKDVVIAEIFGRVDTSTAPKMEDEICNSTNGINEIILDCKNLEYISSAGLRVVLKLHKMMHNRKGLKLTNVGANIVEIFDIVGFSDILCINQ